jgi:hypothetical protein
MFERYVKRPVAVEAIQYQGVTIECLKYDSRIVWNSCDLKDDAIMISTLEGDVECENGGWIIRGSKGELYCSTKEDFSRDYERKCCLEKAKRGRKKKDAEGEVEESSEDPFEQTEEEG